MVLGLGLGLVLVLLVVGGAVVVIVMQMAMAMAAATAAAAAAASDPCGGRGGLGCLRPRWVGHLLVTGVDATCAAKRGLCSRLSSWVQDEGPM